MTQVRDRPRSGLAMKSRRHHDGSMRMILLWVVLCACSVRATDVVLDGATVYPSPEAAPIPDARVVIRNGSIAAMGPRSSTPAPESVRIIDCSGKFIVAGFWNSHVHLIAPGLMPANAPATTLNPVLDEMFNRWGFTHVFDLASSLDQAVLLRDRITRGELRGPRILTVGSPLWTEPPIYIRELVATKRLDVSVVTSPEDVAQRVVQLAEQGVNGIKLFTGSMQAHRAVANMPLAMVSAASREARERNLPIFVHPQNGAGLEAAIEGGANILAHTIPQMAPWTPELVARLKQARIALIPTLALFDFEARRAMLPPAATEGWLELMIGQLRVFASEGGEVLFGTDIGYTDVYDTTLEFRMMTRAGLSFPQILASLTTAPAARFGSGPDTGRVETGATADLVVLNEDPARDSTALAKVHLTLRQGQIIYSASR
jgi:imidazolonepropionase-like amidohydrolase